MTESETATLALLDMLRDCVLRAQKHELLVVGQAQDRIKMGVPPAKVEALFRREIALARVEHRNGNVIIGPWGAAG